MSRVCPSDSYFLPLISLFQIIELLIFLSLCQLLLVSRQGIRVLFSGSLTLFLFALLVVYFCCFPDPSFSLFAHLLLVRSLCLILFWLLALFFYITVKVSFKCFLFMLARLLFVFLVLFRFLFTFVCFWLLVFFLLFLVSIFWGTSILVAFPIWVIPKLV